MTSELAEMGSTLPDMDALGVDRLRRSRLDRLRDARVRDAAEIRRPAVPEPRADQAETLAADVDGMVQATSQRPIVVVESRERIERDLEGLAWLPEPVDPSRPLVLFDTETTGLGSGTGTLPFLVGVGTWEGDEFVTRQLLLPEQSDEAGYLDALEALIPPEACLVSYNGRSFDWPLLVTRYRLHGRRPPAYAEHLDLLPLARAFWKHRLPDARLASVETGICGVRREHDLPGALVPARYLDYLRSGHGALLRDVLEHNRQDVVSMALLLRVLALDLAPVARTGRPSAAVHPGDLGGLGRAYARKRRHPEALACFDAGMERLLEPWEAQRYESIAIDRARTLTRMGLRDEAEGAWHAVALEGGRHAAWAWLHVAKHREHDAADFAAALQATERARVLAERSRLFGRRDRHVERDLARRVPRLRRRLASAAA
ncbi:MAG: ribonuclease H-like domain-containing protein [Chloroflexota bacterium]|nr:ribonuclease H-like domain-containing protein [Chloroflexota bacterium]